ncbi:MFS transporter [Streptacidiphilus albus]|uniref:MFS transporter n=1 Tax=Streptacidiphilus albus TaxID=105425 RepID=UPI000AC44EB7|nr:MFS transporter [Streptacidiphilus albus]
MVRARRRTDGARLFDPAAVVAACAGFALLGALNAFYGPTIPALRSRFGLTPSGAGLALSMFYAGAVCGVLVGGYARRRVGSSRLLVASFSLMALGALGFALAPGWPCALAASLLSGIGAGGMDYGLNGLFAVGFGERSPAMLGILNAHYGLGAVAGPVVISLLGARHYPLAFSGAAALLLLAGWFVRTVREDGAAGGGSGGDGGARVGDSTRSRRVLLPIVFAFLALYALQVAVETGVGAWEPTYLQLLGRGPEFAANATSGFWLMLTVGRFLVAPLTLRWSEPAIVTASCLGTTVCLALASIPALAPYALAGAGLFNAPVFPVALPWLNRAAPGIHWAATGAILTANLGGVAAGPLLGLGIESFGGDSVPWALVAVSCVCLGLAVRLRQTARTPKVPPAVG